MIGDEQDLERFQRELEVIGMLHAAERSLDLDDLAAEFDISVPQLRMDLERLQSAGLCLAGLDGEHTPLLVNAGRQFLARRGQVDADVVGFLAGQIDNLDTREAFLGAGAVMVDEFRAAILDGHGIEHAQELVPPAFAQAVDERLALDLYAAAVALMARLSADEPAGCVAEEILAVALIEEAKVWLEMKADRGELGAGDRHAAMNELRAVFELFQDDDVLNMFEMSEPADAAIAGHSHLNQQLGVADQRVQAWFDPFGWTPATGYLRERAAGSS